MAPSLHANYKKIIFAAGKGYFLQFTGQIFLFSMVP
jgi:hypothetical protein